MHSSLASARLVMCRLRIENLFSESVSASHLRSRAAHSFRLHIGQLKRAGGKEAEGERLCDRQSIKARGTVLEAAISGKPNCSNAARRAFGLRRSRLSDQRISLEKEENNSQVSFERAVSIAAIAVAL